MIEILKFIIRFCYRLFDIYQFRFVDSSVSKGMGSGGSILLESEDVQWFFSRERDEIQLWMGSKYDSRRDKWYPFDLIRSLIEDKKDHFHESGLMDSDNGMFLEENIDTAISLFSKETYKNTLAVLDKLNKQRSKLI